MRSTRIEVDPLPGGGHRATVIPDRWTVADRSAEVARDSRQPSRTAIDGRVVKLAIRRVGVRPPASQSAFEQQVCGWGCATSGSTNNP